MTVKEALNRAAPADLPDLLREVGLGDLMDALANPTTITASVAAIPGAKNVADLGRQPVCVQSIKGTDSGKSYLLVAAGNEAAPDGGAAAGLCSIADGVVTLDAADAETELVVIGTFLPAGAADALDAEWPASE